MKQEFHQYRTSNALDWDTMLSLVRKLYRDGDYRMSLLIGCGAFFGLRISDTLSPSETISYDESRICIGHSYLFGDYRISDVRYL